jgi:hypothetical protein
MKSFFMEIMAFQRNLAESTFSEIFLLHKLFIGTMNGLQV